MDNITVEEVEEEVNIFSSEVKDEKVKLLPQKIKYTITFGTLITETGYFITGIGLFIFSCGKILTSFK